MSYPMFHQDYHSPINETSEYGFPWYECNCCPYGYHIDLDFVRYCESISHENDSRSGSIKRRKDRRRQRQSMEVLLGLTSPIVAALEQNYKLIGEQHSHVSPQTLPSKFYLKPDGFENAVSDFEKIFQKSKNKLSNNLPDVTAVSGANSLTLLSGVQFDSNVYESGGMSPQTLQNIREQMALSLERTRQLENQVKLLPQLKKQLSSLQEENRLLLLRLENNEIENLNCLNGNYIGFTKTRQRSQSFTNVDNLKSLVTELTNELPKKDCGVMCSALTRNIGVGHQNPSTRNVSTITDYDSGDKWLHEKIKFLNIQHLNYYDSNLRISKETQTSSDDRNVKHVGIQYIFESQKTLKVNSFSQTCEIQQKVRNIGISATTKYSDASVQKRIECYSIGCSDDTVDKIFCEKCLSVKRSVSVGPDRNEDTHTFPLSLALLNSRSKSFNLGDDKVNLTSKTRTVASQYEVNSVSRSCQSTINVQSYSKSCQSEKKTFSDKMTQCENKSVSQITDTLDLILYRNHVSCEAKDIAADVRHFGSNTTMELSVCRKCDKEKEDFKDVFKKEINSPIPSRIPRPQIPTTPVEIRKLRRQDTFTKIYSLPEKSSLHSKSPILDLLPETPFDETNSIDRQTHHLEFTEAPSLITQNEPITKVQVQEISLPMSESTIFRSIANQNRQKSVPSKEMLGAMKVLNDLLEKDPSKRLINHSATSIIQQEWFKASSSTTANPINVEDYLDVLEDMSSTLLEYVVNLSDSSGNTAMHYAVSHSNFDVVSILLDSKVCDVNKQNKAGYTSVMLVSLAEVKSQTHANVVKRLFQMADVNVRAKQHGQTALMLAVSHGHLDMVKMLLEAGADINIQDEDGSTALMCAAEHGHVDIIKHFLSHPDCDSTLSDIDGSTALKIAMEAGHRHIGVLLYAHERNLQKVYGSKLKKTKTPSPKSPLSPLMSRSTRALTDVKPK